MSSIRALDRAMQSTLNKALDYIVRDQPYPPWLEKQVEAIHLMVTDEQAGLGWYKDGLIDERDTYRGIWISRCSGRIEEIEGAIREANLAGPGDEEDEMQETEQHG
jgi:hypothetical protein